MSNFLHGLGGGLGRGIGRAIGILAVAFLLYFIINLLDVDIKNDIISRVLMLNVSAREQTSNITTVSLPYDSSCSGSGSKYCATTTGEVSTARSLNTTYNGVLQGISFDFSYTMNTSYQYTLNIKAMSTDFRNNNLFATVCGYNAYPSQCTSLNVTTTFVDKSLIQITFPRQTYTNYTVYIGGSPLTGISTYGIKSLYLTYEDGTVDNSDIINNQNSNTSDIISNANNNTQDLISQINDQINNDNSNFINNLNAERSQITKVCTNGYDTPLKVGKSLSTSDGSLIDKEGSFYTEDYINIDFISGTKTRLYIDNPPNSSPGYILVAYDSNKAYLGRVNTATRSWSFPTGTQYFRFSSPVSNTFIYANEKCITNEKLINDTLNDDSVDQSQANSFFNDFQDDDHGLASIITLPLATIQTLTSSTCIALQLPIPFTNEYVTLPCMSQIYQSKVPALYNLWQVVCYGLIGYWIGTDIFKLVKGFKDPEQDKVEVMDL